MPTSLLPWSPITTCGQNQPLSTTSGRRNASISLRRKVSCRRRPLTPDSATTQWAEVPFQASRASSIVARQTRRISSTAMSISAVDLTTKNWCSNTWSTASTTFLACRRVWQECSHMATCQAWTTISSQEVALWAIHRAVPAFSSISKAMGKSRDLGAKRVANCNNQSSSKLQILTTHLTLWLRRIRFRWTMLGKTCKKKSDKARITWVN